MTTRYFDVVNKEYYPAMFDFRCKNNFFSIYLKSTALYDRESNLGTTHLFLEEDENNKGKKRVIGFYTLKNTSLVFKEDDENTRLGYPAIEISQFATHEDLERTGIGTIMINNIIATTHELTNISAIKYIVLCSVDDSIEFYEKMEFEFLDDKKMFIPRENLNKNCRAMFKHINLK
ncbi:GNAT family N-acetyltransferase [Clostridium botulinum]|nr:GNAT family N-acetyltransferase [Clostridium botulinum]EKS4395950.1 GNAT family N-acetyltransferase [Clostridium botulinum]